MNCELLAFAVTKLHVDYIQAKKSEDSTPNQFESRGEQTQINFGMNLGRHITNERQFQMTLSVKASEQTKEAIPLGFRVEASVIGVLMVSAEVPLDEVLRAAQMNGVSLLYGTLRGIVLTTTSCFPPSGGMMLKAMSPADILGTLKFPLPTNQARGSDARKSVVSAARPARKRRESPAVAGVTSAQKVLAALAEKDDPKPNKTSR